MRSKFAKGSSRYDGFIFALTELKSVHCTRAQVFTNFIVNFTLLEGCFIQNMLQGMTCFGKYIKQIATAKDAEINAFNCKI